MSQDMTLYASGMGGGYILQLDLPNIHMMVCQSAAMIIDACRTLPTDGSAPTEGAGGVLAEHVRWADHGYTNALRAHVEFVYAVVDYYVENRGKTMLFLRENQGPNLLAEALQAFQDWKTALCQHDEKVHGEGWGSATSFYQRDWTAHNQELLAIVA